MAEAIIVGVPEGDTADLASLAVGLEVPQEPAQQRYFDGAAFAEVILPLVFSAGGWATLSTWIKSRAEVRKATRVSFRGVEITAMDTADAERLLGLLAKQSGQPDDVD